MRLRWTPGALKDLEIIGDFIARDKTQVAEAWVAKLFRVAEQAGRFPRSGRIVPEYGREEVREVLAGNYRLIYQILGKEVRFLSVLEGHKPLG